MTPQFTSDRHDGVRWIDHPRALGRKKFRAAGCGLLALVMGATMGPSQALAQCADTGGGVIVCPSDDPDGYETTAPIVSFTIPSGVVVSPVAGDAVVIGHDVSGNILIDGEINAPGGFAEGLSFGSNVVVSGNITINGSVFGQFKGIDSGGTFVGDVTNRGTITGTSTAFAAADILGNFYNHNEIIGGLALGVSLENLAGGFFNYGNIAVGASGLLNETVGVQLGGVLSGGVHNWGRIDSFSTGALSTGFTLRSLPGATTTLNNMAGGVITGQIGVRTEDGNEVFTNLGTITGRSGTAVRLGAGDDTFVVTPSSVTDGTVDGETETTADTLRFADPTAASLTSPAAFDLSEIGNSNKYRNFEIFDVLSGTWSFFGTTGENVTVTGGILQGTGTFNGLTTVNGGILRGTGTFANTELNGGILEGAATFNGLTTVNGGILRGTGTFANTELNGGILEGAATFNGLTIVNGGILRGTGTFANIEQNGGIIAPGNSVGTITVTNNYFINSGTYQVEIEGSASDLINVDGTATIVPVGTTLDIIADPDNLSPSTVFTIIEAGLNPGSAPGPFRIGTFASVVDNLPDLDFEVIYTATEVQLRLAAASSNGAAGGSTTPKQVHPSSLGAGMHANRLFAQTLRRRGGLAATSGLGTTTSNLAAGFSAASSSASQLGAPRYLGARTGPRTGHGARASTKDSPGEVLPARPRRLAMWGAMLGSTHDIDSDAGVGGWDAKTRGFAFGFETAVRTGLAAPMVVGLAGGYTRSDVESGTSQSDIDNLHIGLYSAGKLGSLRLSGALTYAWQQYETTRAFQLGTGDVAVADGETDGFTFTSAFEAVYDITGSRNGLAFGPLLAVDTVYGDMAGFTETGVGILNLAVDDANAHQTTTALGLAFRYDRTIDNTRMHFDARVAWEHVFGDRTIVQTTSLANFSAAAFTTTSAPIDANRLAVGVAAGLEITDRVTSHLRYDGAYSKSSTEHSGSLGVTVRF